MVITPIIEDHSADVESLKMWCIVSLATCTEYQVHKLPSDSGDCLSDSFSSGVSSKISSQLDSILTYSFDRTIKHWVAC